MQNNHDMSAETEATGRFWSACVPLILSVLCLFIGMFFRRPDMGDPDSYRQALSALAFVHDGTYSSYWDFALTMYTFVFGTYLASVFRLDNLSVLNAVAVILGASTVWPLYQLVRRLLNPYVAAFASAAYILSPTFIRYSTYLSHEVVGFTFALWSVYLFERAVQKQGVRAPFLFGLCFGAAFTARTNGAAFIVPPLLALFLWRRDRFKAADIARFASFSLLGFVVCLLLVHRPETVLRFKSRMDVWFTTYYDIGRFVLRTTGTAVQSLTPMLVATAAAGACVLAYRRKYFVAVFGCIWIATVYLFYVGMDICRLKFFLVVVPPCLLLTFGGADQIDTVLKFGRERSLHAAKLATLLLLLCASLGPSLSDLLYIRHSDDAKIVGEGIGRVVGPELLFTTSLRPTVNYYNRESPPETVYLITELEPGTLQMDTKAMQLAIMRLRQGRPVFATGIIIEHFRHLNIDFDADLVWEYKQWKLFRITRLNLNSEGT